MPNTGSAERERSAKVAYFEKKLAYFQRIPSHRREAECADEGERTCRAMIAQLRSPEHLPRQYAADDRYDELQRLIEG